MAQANSNDTTPSLSQLLYTHEKVCNLARGPLSRPVVAQLQDTAIDLATEIGKAPAHSWDEFHRKMAVLLEDWGTADEFLEAIRGDVCRLAPMAA